MVWREFVTDAYVQIADTDAANGWAQYAFDQSGPDAELTLKSQTWEQQRAHVRLVFDAVANAYAAANVPPVTDPDYGGSGNRRGENRGAFLTTFGVTVPRDIADGVAHRIGALGGGSWYGGPSIVRDRIAARYTALGMQPPIDFIGHGGDSYGICDIIIRINLSHRATVVTQCFEGLAGNDQCDFRGAYRQCTQATSGSADNACAGYDWDTLAWIPGRWLTVFDADRSGCAILEALPPLLWFLQFAHAIAFSFASRGALRVIDDARLNVIALNAKAALDLGLLSGELLTQAESLQANFSAAPLSNPQKRQAIAALGTAATLITSAGAATSNPYVAAAGAIVGIIAAVYAVTPDAIGIETDPFGRALPVFETGQISGGAVLSSPPTQIIPPPPAGYPHATPVSPCGPPGTNGAILEIACEASRRALATEAAHNTALAVAAQKALEVKALLKNENGPTTTNPTATPTTATASPWPTRLLGAGIVLATGAGILAVIRRR